MGKGSLRPNDPVNEKTLKARRVQGVNKARWKRCSREVGEEFASYLVQEAIRKKSFGKLEWLWIDFMRSRKEIRLRATVVEEMSDEVTDGVQIAKDLGLPVDDEHEFFERVKDLDLRGYDHGLLILVTLRGLKVKEAAAFFGVTASAISARLKAIRMRALKAKWESPVTTTARWEST